MSLHLHLTVATYHPMPDGKPVDRWTWTLYSGSRDVSSSSSQLYSRRIDCGHGAERGAGVEALDQLLSISRGLTGEIGTCYRFTSDGSEPVKVTIHDEREGKP